MKRIFFWLAVSSIVALNSCGNDTIVGSGLLSEEELNVEFIDTVGLKAKTIAVDSTLVFTFGNTSTQTFMMGRLEDPYFGVSECEVIVTAGFSGNGFLPDFEGVTAAELDSCILVLQLDTLGVYGDPDATFDIEVFRLTQDLTETDSFLSNVEYPREMTPIGTYANYKPASLDSIYIQEFGDSVLRTGTIRIPIDMVLATDIMEWVKIGEVDSTFVVDDAGLAAFFSGFVIKATPSNDAMMAVNLSPATYTSDLSELAIYYRQDTLVNRKYGLSVGLRKSTYIQHDYNGSIVKEAINGDFTFGDSLLFLESLAGTNIEFDISHIENIDNIDGRLLNYAELELVVADLMDYNIDNYPPIQIALASTSDEDNNLILVEDISAIGFPNDVEEFTEGTETYWKYKIPVTRYVQDVINKVENGDNLTISAILKAHRPNRSIIFGPNHSTYPSKLKLTFTNP